MINPFEGFRLLEAGADRTGGPAGRNERVNRLSPADLTRGGEGAGLGRGIITETLFQPDNRRHSLRPLAVARQMRTSVGCAFDAHLAIVMLARTALVPPGSSTSSGPDIAGTQPTSVCADAAGAPVSRPPATTAAAASSEPRVNIIRS